MPGKTISSPFNKISEIECLMRGQKFFDEELLDTKCKELMRLFDQNQYLIFTLFNPFKELLEFLENKGLYSKEKYLFYAMNSKFIEFIDKLPQEIQESAEVLSIKNNLREMEQNKNLNPGLHEEYSDTDSEEEVDMMGI